MKIYVYIKGATQTDKIGPYEVAEEDLKKALGALSLHAGDTVGYVSFPATVEGGATIVGCRLRDVIAIG